MHINLYRLRRSFLCRGKRDKEEDGLSSRLKASGFALLDSSTTGGGTSLTYTIRCQLKERDAFLVKRHLIDIFHIIPCHLVLTSCPLS